MTDHQEDLDRQNVFLFLDESGTSKADPYTLVGATAFLGVGSAESAIMAAGERALGNAAIWTSDEKRAAFGETGFHFAEDSESVRHILLTEMERLDFRAYVAYAKNDPNGDIVARLISMYGTLLSSVIARYRDTRLTVVFEENTIMDRWYGKIWDVLTDAVSLQEARAFRGTKDAPCLAVTDYVLGVTRTKLGGRALPFQVARYVALGRNLAYLIDFDDDRHLGGTRHPIV